MFAPVADLGLAVVWDDGDDLHAEPRAPYPHVREVLAMRAAHRGLRAAGRRPGAYGGGGRRSSRPGARTRSRHRARWSARTAPAVRAAGDDAELATDGAARSARLPTLAWQTARDALRTGPVLVQVPRRGYLPALACVALPHAGAVHHLRRSAGPGVRPDRRGVPVVRSTGDRLALPGVRGGPVPRRRGRGQAHRGGAGPLVPRRARAHVGPRRGPGPRRRRPGAWSWRRRGPSRSRTAATRRRCCWTAGRCSGRPDLRAAEETLRRWLAAAALVRPAADGGRVVVLADSEPATGAGAAALGPGRRRRARARRPAAAALPARGHVWRRCADPPTRSPTCSRRSRASCLQGADVLGPTPYGGDGVRALVRVDPARGLELAAALKAGQAVRSARKAADFVTVTVDPADLG